MPSPLSIDSPRESFVASRYSATPPQYIAPSAIFSNPQHHYQHSFPQQPYTKPPALSSDTLRPPTTSHRSGPPLTPIATQHTKPAASNSPTHPRSGSPVAPEYSPITPKVQPVLPVGGAAFIPPPENGGAFTFSMADTTRTNSSPQQSPEHSQPVASQQPPPQQREKQSTPPEVIKAEPDVNSNTPPKANEPAAEAVYIPQPPDHPFSTDDATDAIALRAAISTLQFQKKKAQDDMRTLARIKQMALDDPDHFKTELAAGRLKEQRPVLGGNMQAILDDLSDGDDDEDFVFPTSKGADKDTKSATALTAPQPGEATATTPTQGTKAFPRIPGAQDVVRMPYVNWDKYGIVGEPLESIHAQQKKWPGTASGSGQNRGREYAVAAPYSAFHDRIDTSIPQIQHRAESRKDSAAVSPSS